MLYGILMWVISYDTVKGRRGFGYENRKGINFTKKTEIIQFCARCQWVACMSYIYKCFSGVRVTRSLVLSVCFVDRCLFLCTFFFWALCCLSFDLRIMITPFNKHATSKILFYTKFCNIIFIYRSKDMCPDDSIIGTG